MAIHYGGKDISFTAAEDLSSHQYRFVHQASDSTVDLLDSESEYSVGVLQNAPESGEIAVVRIDGTSKLVMNGAFSLGQRVKAEYVGATDNGKGDLADTDLDHCRGRVIETSGAEDDIGGILLTDFTIQLAPSESPSESPSNSPSNSPSESPSLSPSASESPSESPSASPSE